MNRLAVLCLAGALIFGAVVSGEATTPESPYFDYALDEGIFTVYAALNRAGYDQVTNYFGMHPLRRDIRASLRERENLEEPVHRIAHAAHELGHLGGIYALSRYVGLTQGPPDFTVGDLSAYSTETRQLMAAGEDLELSHALADFYRKAGIAALWKEARPEYERVVRETDGAAGNQVEAALSAMGLEPGQVPGRVVVIPNLMTPYWSVTRFDFEGRTYVMFGPDVRPDASVPVRAVLEMILTGAVEDHLLEIRAKRDLFELVRDHERIDQCCGSFRDLVTECMVWAVWLRVSGKDPRWVRGELDRMSARGYIGIETFYDAVAEGPAKSPSELVGRALDRMNPDRETARWLDSEEERARWLSLFQADLDRRQGRLSDALIKYEDILAADEANPRAHYGYGSLLFTQERYDDARGMLERAISLEPDEDWVLAWSWIRLGWIEDVDGNRENAVRAYQNAVNTDNTYMNAVAVARHYLTTRYEP